MDRLKLFSRELHREIEVAPGDWLPWFSVAPPRHLGPVLCRRGEGKRFTADPDGVPPEWNVMNVFWQVPIHADHS